MAAKTARAGLEQTLGQRMAQVQMQMRLARMIELTAPELDDAVQRELIENPALEARDDDSSEQTATDDGDKFSESGEELQRKDYADPDDVPLYLRHARNRSRDDYREMPLPADTSESLYDILLTALGQRKLPQEVAQTARYIIGNLDSNGYLQRTQTGIADDMAINYGVQVSPQTVAEAVRQVQELEPYGIGASDLRECLMIQLRHLPASKARDDAAHILDKAYDAFTKKRSNRIVTQLHLPQERVTAALELIQTLNPRPGAGLGGEVGSTAAPVIPDFDIDVEDGEITVSLNNSIPDLQISESFAGAVRMMNENARKRKEAPDTKFITDRYRSAKEFIELLKLRQTTLFSVMTAIVKVQREYFLTEDVHKLRPMGIKDLEEMTGYDKSVISRVTAEKYASLPWGVFPLRFFFGGSLGEGGEEYTAKAVEDIMRQLVDAEDKRHPLSDDALRAEISKKGYEISRRTVAKYRDRMKIPVARLRREM